MFNDTLGTTTVTQHPISTGDTPPIASQPHRIVANPPIASQPHRIAAKWKEQLEQEVQLLLSLGIITPSTSPWASPVVCVKKKDGTIRMCVDYSSATLDDFYPLPRMDELPNSIGGTNYISTLDLLKVYYQIPVSPSDQQKTVFVAPCTWQVQVYVDALWLKRSPFYLPAYHGQPVETSPLIFFCLH